MKKKFFACAVLICLVLQTIFPIAISADTDIRMVTVSGAESMYYQPTVKLQSSDADYEGAYEVLREGLKNREKEINISEYNIPLDDVKSFYIGAVCKSPELSYVRTSYSYTYSYAKGCISTILPDYIDDITPEMSAQAEKLVDNIIAAHITDTMTDIEKALVLHDYLVHSAVYDSEAANSMDYESYAKSYTAYGVLMNKTGVCQSYALAYGWLLNKCGIDWEYVTSNSMHHAWNGVKIDGEWYHVDVTWDDPVNSTPWCRHKYFMITDEQIRKIEEPTVTAEPTETGEPTATTEPTETGEPTVTTEPTATTESAEMLETAVEGPHDHYNWVSSAEYTGSKYSQGDWVFRNTSGDDYIVKYNSEDGKYYYNIKKYISEDEMEYGVSYFQEKDGRIYYKTFVKSDFAGTTVENSSEDEYNAVVYPFAGFENEDMGIKDTSKVTKTDEKLNVSVDLSGLDLYVGQTIRIYAALYDDTDVMYGVAVQEIVAESGKNTFKLSMDNTENISNPKVNIFVWDKNEKPLCDNVMIDTFE